MYEKHRRPLVHVYPPFPSLTWVMTAQANPPSQAYAHGYVKSAHAHGHGHTTRTRTRLSAHRAASCACHPSPHSTRTPSSSPAAHTREVAATAAAVQDEGLMVRSIGLVGSSVAGLNSFRVLFFFLAFQDTVDYRYHDPPLRRPYAYVPWHEGYTLSRQGAPQQKHHHPEHQQSQMQHKQQHALPDSLFAVAASVPRTVATTTMSRCRRSIGDSDLMKTTTTTTTTTIDVVKIKRRAVSALSFFLF